MTSSIGSTPFNSDIRNAATLRFSKDTNGPMSVYLESEIKQYKGEEVYSLREATSKTENLANIAISGLLGVLEVKNGEVKKIFIHKRISLVEGVTKFVYSTTINNKNLPFPINEIPVSRIDDRQYKKLASRLNIGLL